jgi:uncharacterized protein (DUF885 family)
MHVTRRPIGTHTSTTSSAGLEGHSIAGRCVPRRVGQRPVVACILAVLVSGLAMGAAQGVPPADTGAAPDATSELRDLVSRYALDRAALLRRYPVEGSPVRQARLREHYREWQRRIDATPFEPLALEGRLDHLLLRLHLEYQLRLLEREEAWRAEAGALLPFAGVITALDDARLAMEPLDPREAATTLNRLADVVDGMRSAVAAKTPAQLTVFRAQEILEELIRALGNWSNHYSGYDPLFTWWTAAPLKRAATALDAYRRTLRADVLDIKGEDDEPIVGTPIGREALVADLASELVPYSPDELLAIAERELAWCEHEMKKAAREIGFGDDWHAALEKVKTLHVEPGRQPELIRDLAREAEEYVETHDLVTVPALAKEIWRLQMMSPERQRVNPFFTGGETISVSFPTDTMAHDDKLMSMRGNNIHFARATVFHELIPGHHLQGFMNARYNSHRNAFRTPFWGEGWAVYWEMLLWDRGFQQSPENQFGMLFWRMFRAARIIFSLRFHLGDWTPQACIDFIIDRVGHERANAEAEVRRSFNGTYPPLYQLAYMIGALQFRALHAELVGKGTMTDREFHDAILAGGVMPVELVRARLTRQSLSRDHRASWAFEQYTQTR